MTLLEAAREIFIRGVMPGLLGGVIGVIFLRFFGPKLPSQKLLAIHYEALDEQWDLTEEIIARQEQQFRVILIKMNGLMRDHSLAPGFLEGLRLLDDWERHVEHLRFDVAKARAIAKAKRSQP